MSYKLSVLNDIYLVILRIYPLQPPSHNVSSCPIVKAFKELLGENIFR